MVTNRMLMMMQENLDNKRDLRQLLSQLKARKVPKMKMLDHQLNKLKLKMLLKKRKRSKKQKKKPSEIKNQKIMMKKK